MRKQHILSIIVIGMIYFVVCDALQLDDSGRLLRNVGQRRQLVNVTQHSVKNNRLLALIKNLHIKQQFDDNIRRGVRKIIAKWRPVPDATNRQRIRKRRALRPRKEQKNLQPVFDADIFIGRLRGNKLTICERVSCNSGTYVTHCVENFTADVCTSCPPGTNLYDTTKSDQSELKCQPIHHCHHWPGTVPTTEMHACAGDYRMQCRCDTESGICGLDPCNCRKQKCRHDEVLLQNCTCENRVTTTVKVQMTTTKVSDSTPASSSLQHTFTTKSPPQLKTGRGLSTTAPLVISATENSNSGDKVSWYVTMSTPLQFGDREKNTPAVTHDMYRKRRPMWEIPVELGMCFCALSLGTQKSTVGATIGIFCLFGILYFIYHYRQKFLDCLSSSLSERLQFHPLPLEN